MRARSRRDASVAGWGGAEHAGEMAVEAEGEVAEEELAEGGSSIRGVVVAGRVLGDPVLKVGNIFSLAVCLEAREVLKQWPERRVWCFKHLQHRLLSQGELPSMILAKTHSPTPYIHFGTFHKLILKRWHPPMRHCFHSEPYTAPRIPRFRPSAPSQEPWLQPYPHSATSFTPSSTPPSNNGLTSSCSP